MLITAADITAWTGETSTGADLDRVNTAIADVSASIDIFLLSRGLTVPSPTPAALVAIARMEVRRVLNSEPGVSTERIGDLSSGYAYGGAAFDLSPGAERALKRYVRSVRGSVGYIQLVRPENWDEIPPTTPTNLAVTSVTADSISLSWLAATDNIVIAGYRVYEGTTLVADVCGTSATICGLAAGSSHTYTVLAYDGLGNRSPLSASVTGVTST